jgi:hypothetical protein
VTGASSNPSCWAETSMHVRCLRSGDTSESFRMTWIARVSMWAQLRWVKPGRGGTYPSLQVSDHEGQFGERVGETSRRSDIGPEVVKTPAEVLDKACPATITLAVRSPFSPRIGRRRALRRPCRSRADCSGGLRVVEGRREQLTQDARVDPLPVGGDLGGRNPSPADRLGE